MIGIAAAWLDPKRAYSDIETLSCGAGLLPQVEEASERLRAAQPTGNSGKNRPTVIALRTEEQWRGE